MAYKTLILGASYGSLLGTKLAMAGHDVTLVCREATAALINSEGTEVRIKFKGEDAHRAIRSTDLPGKIDACTPEQADPAQYDMVALAMQEPQYGAHSIRTLLMRVAVAGVPCLSIMNMPPLPYLKRIPGLEAEGLEAAFTEPRVWDRFDPELVTLCSPDPQAFRPPEEGANILHVGLPTNFKAALFGKDEHNQMLRRMEADIAAVRLDGHDVPVKLRAHESIFVPLAKWSMLLTGNYRCVTMDGVQPIRDAVHGDIEKSRSIYAYVDEIARKLGADPADQVPFEKYAKAAESLLKPSSAARAIDGGAPVIERVDRVVQVIGRQLGVPNSDVDAVVATIDARLSRNEVRAA
ncbi:MAG: 2-dehydropantoate 2-reductase N-terminal domain-containing protein [Pseudomonadota bacterium]